MDPKGDRLRKIQMGQLKLPESVLKINNIQLTEVNAQGGGGCLDGGSRPRPLKFTEEPNKSIPKPTMISSDKKTPKTVSPEVIHIHSNADIPLPSAGDIPLPKPESIPLPCGDVPKPCPEDIPLPSNDSIPLPADKPIVQPSERRKIRVLVPLEPYGDELLCRSCAMRFSKQQEYDTHLQSEEHQQTLKEADLFGSKSPGNSLNQRPDKKSPSHDAKAAHVSFGFKKNLGGSRITNTQPFARREEYKSPIEIKLLKPETENGVQADEESTENDKNIANVESIENLSECKKTETEGYKDNGGKVIDSKLMCSFLKVHSKDESGRVLDWPKEMIQYTETEPKIIYSCNPLVFDFSKLFDAKPKKASKICSITACDNNLELENETVKATNKDNNAEKVKIDGHEKKGTDEEKKKSHKKKKKKHHKKHSDKSDKKEVEQDKNKETVESKGGELDKCDAKADNMEKKLPAEGSISSKKKKKKHKRKSDQENKENKETDKRDDENKESVEADDSEKKKHKKSKKKSKHPEEIAVKVDSEEEKKHKKRKKKKSKKKKRKLDSEADKSEGEGHIKKAKNVLESAHESDGEKENDGKRKPIQEKHNNNKGDVNTDKNESCENEVEMVDIKVENSHNVNVQQVSKSKFSGAESDSESEKIMAKLQALSRTKTVQKSVATDTVTQKMVNKDILKIAEKKTLEDRKRLSCESNVNDSTIPIKKLKVTSKVTDVKDNVAIETRATVKIEKEDSWSKIETQTNDNVKSKWDSSDSDMENPLDKTVKKEKMLKRIPPVKGLLNKTPILKALKSPPEQISHKVENDNKKIVNPSLSNRSNRSNLSTGSNQLKIKSNNKRVTKSKQVTKTPVSSHSRSRSHSHSYHRSYSQTGSSSRSRSYSSSYYSDHSRHSRRHRRNRCSSSRSYSGSTSRSHSRSHRGHSLSYSESSRSRSYSSRRSHSRSNRIHKRSYSRSRSRSYSSTSYSSRSRSRNRYRKKGKCKVLRKSLSKPQTQSPSPVDKVAVDKKKSVEDKKKSVEEKRKVKEEKVDPSEIPLPNLSNENDDERTEEKLQKLKEKKRKTDVGETVAKLVESRPSDIPLPFSDTSAQTVSSDSLPTGPPIEALKESDTGFIGPKMPAPPPPPPQFNNPMFAPNHGPLGLPRPGYGPGMWDHWDTHGPWDGPGPWDVPGHRPPLRGMRPPYDPRMYGPYDPRRRGPPPPYMNRPRGPPFLGSRYPVPYGPRPDYPPEYDSLYTEDEKPKRESPPPLPKEPPREPSPKPPPPKIKEQKEPEQNPDIVIPPEQVELYKNLQKQAAKHARRQLRRQAKKDVGEPDSTSSESEPEEQPEEVPEEVQLEEMPIYEDSPQIITISQPMILAQPQPASSPNGGYVVVVSGGQQYLMQKSQAGMAIQTGQPMIFSQGSLMASAAHPTRLMQAMPQMVATPAHMTGVPMTLSSLHQLHQIQQMQQIQQLQHIQQIQNAHAIQAHNQAVAMAAAQHGPIIVGNRLLVPTIGMRPAM